MFYDLATRELLRTRSAALTPASLPPIITRCIAGSPFGLASQ